MTEPVLQTFELSKHFGAFTALDQVSLALHKGTVHALLGENGAGKSTLVKCLVGFHPADAGAVLVQGREVRVDSAEVARALGIGMVYQHFTLVPSLTVAQNLSLVRPGLPQRIDWKEEFLALEDFMASMPFTLPLHRKVAELAAGLKQKAEIVKQLYARTKILILDEPTSVLTPQEAQEVLAAIKSLTRQGQASVILITHKFREVEQFADEVTVLRKGKKVGHGLAKDLSTEQLAQWMVGDALAPEASLEAAPEQQLAAPLETLLETQHGPKCGSQYESQYGSQKGAYQIPCLSMQGLSAKDDRGAMALNQQNLQLYPGEILGIAGVSGNGQKELMQVLCGQRIATQGQIFLGEQPLTRSTSLFGQKRRQALGIKMAALPEEPLQNASVGNLSVADNMALRHFDQAPLSRHGWLQMGQIKQQAQALIDSFKVKTRGPHEAIKNLSGGNIQRAVLARELSQKVQILLVMNPVFGLDFAAVKEIHARLRAARAQGTAILLISEDLDEVLGLADRVLVMVQGRFVYESAQPGQDREKIGQMMGAT